MSIDAYYYLQVRPCHKVGFLRLDRCRGKSPNTTHLQTNMEENLTKLNKILINLSDFDRKLNQYMIINT